MSLSMISGTGLALNAGASSNSQSATIMDQRLFDLQLQTFNAEPRWLQGHGSCTLSCSRNKSGMRNGKKTASNAYLNIIWSYSCSQFWAASLAPCIDFISYPHFPPSQSSPDKSTYTSLMGMEMHPPYIYEI
jgi:hypothetical protein